MKRFIAAFLLLSAVSCGLIDPQPTCSPSTCIGCCSGDDVCQSGTTALSCGTGGFACMDCPAGQTCGVGGRCAAAAQPPPTQCPSVVGMSFNISITSTSACGAASETGTASLTLSSTGAAIRATGASESLLCNWSQSGCSVSLNCDNSGITNRWALTMSQNGRLLTGTAYLNYSAAACPHIEYSISGSR